MLAAPNRRWYQFRLRTLLIVVALVAVPLAWIAKERRRSRHDQQVAQRLHEFGVMVQFGGLSDSLEPYVDVVSEGGWRYLVRWVFGDRVLALVALERAEFSDLGPLAELTDLQIVDLSSAPVRDLTPLAGLKKLKSLGLDHTQVSDLSPLAALSNLTDLTLSGTKVTSEQVEALQKALPNCQIEHDRFP